MTTLLQQLEAIEADLADRILAALKFDERVWRAYTMLKTIHQDGQLDAIVKATGADLLPRIIATIKEQAGEVERLRELVERKEAGR